MLLSDNTYLDNLVFAGASAASYYFMEASQAYNACQSKLAKIEDQNEYWHSQKKVCNLHLHDQYNAVFIFALAITLKVNQILFQIINQND